MAWAELLRRHNSVQQIQDLYDAANLVTLGRMSEAGLRKAATKRSIPGRHLFHDM
jgi:hypothetical protein